MAIAFLSVPWLFGLWRPNVCHYSLHPSEIFLGLAGPKPNSRMQIYRQKQIHSPRGLCLYLAIACIVFLPGCVQRRMLIRSQPEGAMVTIDHQPVGHTPVAVPFTFYGTRDIEIEKDGFETQKFAHQFKRPWYQIPPFDLISDNFAGREIRDQRLIDVQLHPKAAVFENQLLGRSEELRNNVQRGTIAIPRSP